MCFRALQGLPLPARSLTSLLLESIMARLIRAEDVVLCNYVWMSNHPHMQLYSLDVKALSDFSGQLKKRITDFVKRLLGLEHLNLWDERPTVAEVLDLDAGIERIAYSYLNPVRAGLVSSIDRYEGCNTWKEFLSANPDTNSVIEKEVPWILATDIEQLSEVNPSSKEERRVIEGLLEAAKARSTHTLRIHPFKWLEAFNIKEPLEIEAVRQRIIRRVREVERELATKQLKPNRLEGYIVTDSYVPPKKERKLFMYGSTKEIRIQFLTLFERFLERCKSCYEQMKLGVRSIDWPPECFIPPAPRLCNVFA